MDNNEIYESKTATIAWQKQHIVELEDMIEETGKRIIKYRNEMRYMNNIMNEIIRANKRLVKEWAMRRSRCKELDKELQDFGYISDYNPFK